MDFAWPQLISFTSVGMFLYLVAIVFLVFFVPMSRGKTRFFCNTGVSACLLLAVNCGVLYYWHHYFR